MKKNIKTQKTSSWIYRFVLGIVILVCLGALWFSYSVFVERSKPSSHVEVTILMPKEQEKVSVIVKDKNDVSQAVDEAKENKAYMAIVIDDMGVSSKHTQDILSLKAPLTSSFLTYAQNLDTFCSQAKEAGHEIMIHVPMEPEKTSDLAPDMLTVSMTDEEIGQNVRQMLQKFDGFEVKGINNHMGSLLTASAPKMDAVMKELHQANLFFLDSKTTAHSVAEDVAKINNVFYFKRDVFLDNENDKDYVLGQLKEAEELALKHGFVIAIGHPKDATYQALQEWLESKDMSVRLVHLSDMVTLFDEKK